MARRQTDGSQAVPGTAAEAPPRSIWDEVRTAVAKVQTKRHTDKAVPAEDAQLRGRRYADQAVGDLHLAVSRLGFVLVRQVPTCARCEEALAEVVPTEEERQVQAERALIAQAQNAANGVAYRQRMEIDDPAADKRAADLIERAQELVLL